MKSDPPKWDTFDRKNICSDSVAHYFWIYNLDIYIYICHYIYIHRIYYLQLYFLRPFIRLITPSITSRGPRMSYLYNYLSLCIYFWYVIWYFDVKINHTLRLCICHIFALNEPINPLTVSLRTYSVHGEDPSIFAKTWGRYNRRRGAEGDGWESNKGTTQKFMVKNIRMHKRIL